jgi:heme/copper-type cytochrome/quinol oxidase subunit 4
MWISVHRKQQEIEIMEWLKKLSEKNRGVVVFIALAILTAIEYVLAITGMPVIILVVLALLKAALVLNYFMHIGRLFSSGEGGHS